MKNLSSSFVRFSGQKLIPRYFILSNSDNLSFVNSKFSALLKAFILGVHFREEFSKSSVKAKKEFCSDFPMSDIYSEYLKSFKSFFK